MADRRTRAPLLDGTRTRHAGSDGRRAAPLPPSPAGRPICLTEAHLVLVAGDLFPGDDAAAILEACGRSAQLGTAPELRVVALPPRRPFDWTAVAWADAASPDGFLWPYVGHSPQREPFDLDAAESQLLLGELLDQLRRSGVNAHGWVDARRSLLAALRDGARDLADCRSVLVLPGPGRCRPPLNPAPPDGESGRRAEGRPDRRTDRSPTAAAPPVGLVTITHPNVRHTAASVRHTAGSARG